MKKTLFIITLFIGLGSVNAQYDATWEETITFIQTYSHEMFNYNSSSCNSGINEFSIEGKELVLKFEFRDGSGVVTSKVDLSKLNKITRGVNSFDIELTGDYIESIFDDSEKPSLSRKMNIQFCDEEYVDRVIKGFEHLAILVSKKRI